MKKENRRYGESTLRRGKDFTIGQKCANRVFTNIWLPVTVQELRHT